MQLKVVGRRPTFGAIHPSVRRLRFQTVGGEAYDHVPHRPLRGKPGLEDECPLKACRAEAGKSAPYSSAGQAAKARGPGHASVHAVGPQLPADDASSQRGPGSSKEDGRA